MNLTPLCEVSSDPNDPFPVSPSALLALRDHAVAPLDTYTENDMLQYGKKRWRRVQYLVEQFWVRWSHDYLSTLQTRNKWKFPSINVQEGDVVIVRETSLRNMWPMGIAKKTYPDSNGLIRRAVIKFKPTVTGISRRKERAIHNLVLLVPGNENLCHSVTVGRSVA